MIRILDLDLARPSPSAPIAGKTWLLVRWGDRVVGEMMLEEADQRFPEVLQDKALTEFGPRIHALRRTATTSDLPAEAPSVSVFVVHEGNPALLDGCLRSVAALDPAPVEVHVIAEEAPQSAVEIWQAASGSFAADIERAVRHAEGDVLVFLDEHCRPDHRFVRAVADSLRRTGADAVAGVVVPFALDTYPQLAFDRSQVGPRRSFELQLHTGDGSERATDIHPGVGGAIAYRGEALVGNGMLAGMDRMTRRAAEYSIIDRLLSRGSTVGSDPDVVMWHVHPRTRREFLDWVRQESTDRHEHRRREGEIGAGTIAADVARSLARTALAVARGRQLEVQSGVIGTTASLSRLRQRSRQ